MYDEYPDSEKYTNKILSRGSATNTGKRVELVTNTDISENTDDTDIVFTITNDDIEKIIMVIILIILIFMILNNGEKSEFEKKNEYFNKVFYNPLI